MIRDFCGQNVSFSYPDGTSVLEDISFSINQGEFIGVLGANGSGKTTFLKILNRLLKHKKGSITLGGEEIRKMNKDRFFQLVNTMFQNPDDQLFASTVEEDVSFGPYNMGLSQEEVAFRVKAALDAVEMYKFKDKNIHALSFGQKKRICLAGVLAMGPQVMLLDEPTSCLDPLGISSIMQLLKKLNKEQNITMIMATHSVDLVPLFIDRVIVLDKGKVAFTGKPEEMFAKIDLVRDVHLRLPRTGHLFEILKLKDKLNVDRLPLTIGEARQAINDLLQQSKDGELL